MYYQDGPYMMKRRRKRLLKVRKIENEKSGNKNFRKRFVGKSDWEEDSIIPPIAVTSKEDAPCLAL
jgi:hypothetical protein